MPLISISEDNPALQHLVLQQSLTGQHWLSWNQRFMKSHHRKVSTGKIRATPSALVTWPPPFPVRRGIRFQKKYWDGTGCLSWSHTALTTLWTTIFSRSANPKWLSKGGAMTKNHKSQGLSFRTDKLGPKGHQYENTSFPWIRRGGR